MPAYFSSGLLLKSKISVWGCRNLKIVVAIVPEDVLDWRMKLKSIVYRKDEPPLVPLRCWP